MPEEIDLQEIARQIECCSLHVAGNVQIVANDLGQSCLSQFRQLSFGKSNCWVLVFVPKRLKQGQQNV